MRQRPGMLALPEENRAGRTGASAGAATLTSRFGSVGLRAGTRRTGGVFGVAILDPDGGVGVSACLPCRTGGVVGVAILTAILFVVVLMSGCGQKGKPLHKGDPAPEIQATDLNAKAIKLGDYRGKVILVQFWAEACCAEVMSAIGDLFRKHKDKGFVVVAINPVEPKDRVERVVKALRVDVLVGLDQLKLTQKRYHVHGIPCSFLVDRQGVVREKILGDIPKRKLESKLEALLE